MDRRTVLSSIGAFFCATPLLFAGSERLVNQPEYFIDNQIPCESLKVKLDIINKLVIAFDRNILVFDSEARGEFTPRLVSLLGICLRRNVYTEDGYNGKDRLVKIYHSYDKRINVSKICGVELIPVSFDLFKTCDTINKDGAGQVKNNKHYILGVGENGSVMMGSY